VRISDVAPASNWIRVAPAGGVVDGGASVGDGSTVLPSIGLDRGSTGVVGLLVGALVDVRVEGRGLGLGVVCSDGRPVGPGTVCLAEQAAIDVTSSNKHSSSTHFFALIAVSPDWTASAVVEATSVTQSTRHAHSRR
jgi:hypothetical protein